MKPTLSFGLLFCLCLALLSLPGSAILAQSETPTIDPAAIDSYVEQERQAARIPGLAVAIVQGDGSVYLKGYGSAGAGRPVTPQTPFILGSVSKSFTALAVMQLVEAGKIDLDAPIQRYLPWLRFAAEPSFHPEGASAITVSQLLHHTSGIPTYAGEVAFMGQRSASMEELLRKQSRVRLTALPGQKFQYSNLNYVALGALVEAVSGQSFADYLQEHIFTPLEMVHTTSTPGADLSAGYQYLFGIPVQVNPPFRADNLPAGYILSSAEDMSHYLTMWLNAGRYKDAVLISPEGFAALQNPEARVTGYTRYAMGWYTNPDNTVVWHNGSTTNFRTTMKILKEGSLGVVVLYNLNDDLMSSLFGGGFCISEGIISVLYGEKPPVSGLVNNGGIYFVLDGILGMIAAAIGIDILRLRGWKARLLKRKSRLLPIAGTALIHFVLPLLILLGVPALVSWIVVLGSLPDVGYSLVVLSVVLLALGVVKAAWLAQARGAK